ncbi:MAG: chemotaxis protein CheB [Candidatus Omnitrophota bacterium]
MNSKMTPLFPIVGIGASAGGLEAFSDLLKYLPNKTGMAFIFVMHLSADHKSVLSDLLGRRTRMQVNEAMDGMALEPDHVYVIPPDRDMSITGGKLVLVKMKGIGFRHLPVDCLFRSLAEERGNRAIGVILSGTASDGTLGAEAIKAEGGITFAQDPQSAKYDGMPQSAVAAGCIDFTLSPKKIAQELCRIAKHPVIASAKGSNVKALDVTPVKGLEGLFVILRSAKGVDFTHYKTPTMMRRILRRMVLHEFKKIKDYSTFLRDNKDEVNALYEDLLINVTDFFRDQKPFLALSKRIIPKILKNRAKDQEVRIWVPGCSSGEEAYSIAICFAEALGPRAKDIPVRIFATDLSDRSIAKARCGVYGMNIKESVSTERLKRFFIKDNDSYKVSKTLRDMCVFSKQNLFNDPPFSNLDLISCRNMLIYLQPVLQKKIFNYLHYSLRPGGFLLLGISESAGSFAKLFHVLDGKQKIFEKKHVLARTVMDVGLQYYRPKGPVLLSNAAAIMGLEPRRPAEGADMDAMIERAVLSECAPCGVLVNSDMEVVSFRGKTGRYLESSSGTPSHDIFKLAREGLLLPLRVAIHEAKRTGKRVKKAGVVAIDHGRTRDVAITVIPVPGSSEKAKPKARKASCFLVLFDETALPGGPKGRPKGSAGSVKDREYLGTIEKELAETKEYLRTVTEEHETANEELKAANEEILASNAEISILNNDFVNLLGSVNMPIIMMDVGLVIRRVTSQAEKALNIASSDIGRPINKIKLNVEIPDLDQKLSKVIESLASQEFEIQSKDGHWYSVYLKPYRTTDNKIDGVVMIFLDITGHKRAGAVLAESHIQIQNIIDNTPAIVYAFDLEERFLIINDALATLFNSTPKQMIGKRRHEFMPKHDAEWHESNDRLVLEAGKALEFEEHSQLNGRSITWLTMKFPLRDAQGRIYVVAGISTDISARKRVEEALRESEFLLREAQKVAGLGSYVLDITTGVWKSSQVLDEVFGIAEGYERSVEGWAALIHPDERVMMLDYFRHEVFGKGQAFNKEYRIIRNQDKAERWVQGFGRLESDAQGVPVKMLGTIQDITERKKAEKIALEMRAAKAAAEEAEVKLQEIQAAHEELKRTQDLLIHSEKMAAVGTLSAGVAHELNNPLTGILGIARSYIEDKDPASRDYRDLQEMVKAGERMAKIIRGMLDYSRPSIGELEELNCNSVIEAVLEFSQKIMIGHLVDVRKDFEKDLASIKVDGNKIRQVIINLVDNAVDAMEKKGVLRISTRTITVDGARFVEMGFTGSGHGIKPEDISRIFDPFFTTKRPGKGTGLGLAVVQAIIRQHGGEIFVESPPAGQETGTVFTVRLPVTFDVSRRA